ncbi:MAG: OsmC family protein [Pseudobdellovibrionaceae bacterium]
MVTITSKHSGHLQYTSVHDPSSTELLTDAPLDNGGTASSFSPTDLVATALLTCIMTTIELYAARHDLKLDGMHGAVQKKMRTESPRRIAELILDIHMPLPADHPMRARLEEMASKCPVHLSLHPDVKESITWHWGAA